MGLRLLLGMAMAFVWSGAAVAAEKKIVLVNDEYAPYVMPEGDAKGPGIDIEIAVEALKRAGYQTEVKIVPWKRVLKSLEDGEADMTTTLSFKDERDKYLDWSVPYRMNTVYHFYTAKGSKLKIASLADLKGKTLGVTDGFTYPKEVTDSKDFTRDEAKDVSKTLGKLVAGRSDAAILNSIVGVWEMNKANLGDKVEKQAFELQSVEDTRGTMMGFSKKRNLKDVVQAFNKALDEMIKDGTVGKLEQKYLK